ncbi:unnamed protein product [Ectocarpus sp. 12 AP-2014]
MTTTTGTTTQDAAGTTPSVPYTATASGGGTAFRFADGAAQWTLWQLCDSGLPTGGFAHSGGLEAAAAQGIVRAKHTGSLLRFVRGALANAASLQLPLLREARRARTLEAWLEVDSVAHACITAEAARRASLAQGAGLLRAAQAMFPLREECGAIVNEFRALVRRGGSAAFSEEPLHLAGGGGGDQATSEGKSGGSGTEKSRTGTKKSGAAPALVIARGHHSPAFGVVCGALGIDEDEAARAFMFLVARDVLSAATRLSLIGPLEAGRLVSSLSGYVETLLRVGDVEKVEYVGDPTGGGSDRGDDSTKEGTDAPRRLLSEEWGGGGGVAGRVCQVDPVQDIVQGLHDRLYSRMFNS